MKLSLNSELVSVRVDLTEGQIVGLVKAAIDMAADGVRAEADAMEDVPEESGEDGDEEIVVEGFLPSAVAGAVPEEEPEQGEKAEGIATPVCGLARNDGEVLEPEDFGELLKAAEKKPKSGEKDVPGYMGFLHMVCPVCAGTKTFNAKYRIKKYKCPEGHVTPLTEDAKKAEYLCECGKYLRYRTNSRSEVITVDCINCGTPTDLMWNEKKGHYQKI